jgi:hypothetical protein
VGLAELPQLNWGPVWITPSVKAHDYYAAQAGPATFRISPKFLRREPGYIADLDMPGDRYGIVEDVTLESVQQFCSWVARAYGWI